VQKSIRPKAEGRPKSSGCAFAALVVLSLPWLSFPLGGRAACLLARLPACLHSATHPWDEPPLKKLLENWTLNDNRKTLRPEGTERQNDEVTISLATNRRMGNYKCDDLLFHENVSLLSYFFESDINNVGCLGGSAKKRHRGDSHHVSFESTDRIFNCHKGASQKTCCYVMPFYETVGGRKYRPSFRKNSIQVTGSQFSKFLGNTRGPAKRKRATSAPEIGLGNASVKAPQTVRAATIRQRNVDGVGAGGWGGGSKCLFCCLENLRIEKESCVMEDGDKKQDWFWYPFQRVSVTKDY
jgi:hypothetical protein